MNQVSPPPAEDGAVIEVDRTVNASGLADQQVGVGSPLAGQRVTLRMEEPLMAVLGHDGTLLRTMACRVPVASLWVPHSDLMPQHEQLRILGCGGPAEQDQPAAEPHEDEIEKAHRHESS
jgi:hypothetical protein